MECELERLHQASFAWALGCCRWRREAAEDVLQASYLKILEVRARFAGRSSFKTWLFSVIRVTAREQWRRWLLGRFWQQPLTAVELRLEAGTDDVHRLESAAEAAALVHALRKLSARQREVLELVFFQELSIEEASKAMDVSLGSARVHYHRGKARLRRLLDGGGGSRLGKE
jgi:RNA polymerase sigma-70 factor (ECF subfamily)